MDEAHSIRSFWNKPPRPINIRETVQLPPIQFLPPLANESLITFMFDRIKDDHGIISHMQCGCRINPMTVPACRTQFVENFLGVITTLTGDDDFTLFQRVDRSRILARAKRLLCRRAPEPCRQPRKLKNKRGDIGKITLFHHALHEDGTQPYRANLPDRLFL